VAVAVSSIELLTAEMHVVQCGNEAAWALAQAAACRPYAVIRRRRVSGRLLTARALAERLDVVPATVLRWARAATSLRSGCRVARSVSARMQVEIQLDEWTTGAAAPAGVVSLRFTDEEARDAG
jgi:hypothetical protein